MNVFLQLGDGCGPAVGVLIHHLAVKVPEKADFRHKASSAIVDLALGLPTGFSQTVRWFVRFGHNEKSAHRLFALEVMGKLMQESAADDKDNANDAPTDAVTGGAGPRLRTRLSIEAVCLHSRLSLFSNLLIFRVERFGLAAVHVHPEN